MKLFKLGFYVPDSHLESVKQALFAAGAGTIGDYDSCCWQTPGQGQFRPLAGSAPYTGEQDVVQQVREYRVEMVCGEADMPAVISALRSTHPYEEPAWDAVELANTRWDRAENTATE